MGDGRSFYAFGQHFAVHWVSWTGSDLNPWTNWADIVAQNFGPAQTLAEAFLNNPAIFARHIAYNILGLGGWPLAFGPAVLVLNEVAVTAMLIAGWGLIVAGVFFPLSRLGRQPWKQLPQAASSSQASPELLHQTQRGEHGHPPPFSRIAAWGCGATRTGIWLGLCAAVGFFSILVIYPRVHYLLIPGLLTLTGLILANRWLLEERRPRAAPALLGGLLAVVLMPPFSSQAPSNQDNLETIRFIQSLEIKQPVNLLEAEGGYHIYLGDNFQRVAETEKDVGWNQFLAARRINLIVKTDLLTTDSRFKNDLEWQWFLTHYADFGFAQVDIPHTPYQLLLEYNLWSGE